MRKSAEERFWEKVSKTESCWLWASTISKGGGSGGYAMFWYEGRPRLAHRWIYERMYGVVAKELTLDHLCRVRHCVNPAHLEPVTHRENVLRGKSFAAVNARKTHCVHGHAYTPANTVKIGKRGRWCRVCRNQQSRDSKRIARGGLRGHRNSQKTHCAYGHAFGGENLIIEKNGSRRCRTCKNARRRSA
jgi:hypothetical protein